MKQLITFFFIALITINSNGQNVGIGTSTPAYPLDVTGNTAITGNFVNTNTINQSSSGVIGNCTTTPGVGYGVTGTGGYVGVYGSAVLSGGNSRTGIWGSGANGTLTNYGVLGNGGNGTGSASNYGVSGIANGGTTAYGIYGTATNATTNWAGYFNGATFCTDGVWQSSDRKLKNNIQPLNGAIAIINRLNPSVYTFKTTEYKQMNLPEGLQYGLIADEIQKVIPGAVKKTVQPAEYENHDMKNGKKLSDEVEFNAVNYSEMIPILIAGIKEQQKMIEQLQIQIASQQIQIEEINKLLKSKNN